MHCQCGRSHTTPRVWYNKDKTLKFYTDSHGITDIVPGPNAEIFKWLKDHDSGEAESWYKYQKNHIHW